MEQIYSHSLEQEQQEQVTQLLLHQQLQPLNQLTMLGNVTKGSKLYVLDKDRMAYETGEVISVTPVTALYPLQSNGQSVDITIKAFNSSLELKNLPFNSNTATCGAIVIAEHKEGITGAVEESLHHSIEVVNSVANHRENISKSEALLRELNPRFKREKEQEEKIESLTDKIHQLEELINSLTKKGGKNNESNRN